MNELVIAPNTQETDEFDLEQLLEMKQDDELDGTSFSSVTLGEGPERVIMYTDAKGIHRWPEIDKKLQQVFQAPTINEIILFVLHCTFAANQLTPEGRNLADYLDIDYKTAIKAVKEACDNVLCIETTGIDTTKLAPFQVDMMAMKKKSKEYLGIAFLQHQDHMIYDWTVAKNHYFVASQHFFYYMEPIRDLEITLTGDFDGPCYVVLRPTEYSGDIYDEKDYELDIVIQHPPKIIACFEPFGNRSSTVEQENDTWVAKLPGLLWLAYHSSRLLDLTIMIESDKIPKNVSVSYDYSQIYLNHLCVHSFMNLCEIELSRSKNGHECVFTNASHL